MIGKRQNLRRGHSAAGETPATVSGDICSNPAANTIIDQCPNRGAHPAGDDQVLVTIPLMSATATALEKKD